MNSPEFDTALRASAAALTRLYPGERLRIDRGLVLALNGAALYKDDCWHVCSASDPEVEYRLLPEGCECPDRQRAPEGRCKHWYCVYLILAIEQDYPPRREETPHVAD